MVLFSKLKVRIWFNGAKAVDYVAMQNLVKGIPKITGTLQLFSGSSYKNSMPLNFEEWFSVMIKSGLLSLINLNSFILAQWLGGFVTTRAKFFLMYEPLVVLSS